MDLREAVIRFHFGEMIKTMLINAGNLSAELAAIEEKDRAPAIKIYKRLLEQIRGEIKTAAVLGGLNNLSVADLKVKEAIWEAHINRPEEASRLLGEAISGTVSSIQSAAERLRKEGLI